MNTDRNLERRRRLEHAVTTAGQRWRAAYDDERLERDARDRLLVEAVETGLATRYRIAQWAGITPANLAAILKRTPRTTQED